MFVLRLYVINTLVCEMCVVYVIGCSGFHMHSSSMKYRLYAILSLQCKVRFCVVFFVVVFVFAFLQKTLK